MPQKHGFDKRIVSYELIHNFNPGDLRALVDAVDPKPKETILDAMCGYGTAGKAVLEREKNISLFVLDESEVQLNRAKENLSGLPKDRLLPSKTSSLTKL